MAYRGIPAFIVTLSGLLGWRASAWLLAGGVNIAPMDEHFQVLGGGLAGSVGAFWSWVAGVVAIVALAGYSFRSRARRQRYGFPVRSPTVQWLFIAGATIAIVVFVALLNAYLHPIRKTPMGIPIPVLLMILVVVVMTIVTRLTRFGRHLYGMGGNPEAAQLSGINVCSGSAPMAQK